MAEFRVAVADQEAKPMSPLAQDHGEVAGLLGHPDAGRLAVTPARWTPPGVELDDEQHMEPPQPDGVEVKKSQAMIPAACWRRNACDEVVARRGADPGAERLRPVVSGGNAVSTLAELPAPLHPNINSVHMNIWKV
jgi:hypothetical protein